MSMIIWTAVITAASTLIFNVLFHILKNQFDWFVDKKIFKRERTYKQLEKLYLEINSIVLQFEFVKKFNGKYVEDYSMSDREILSSTNTDKEEVRYFKMTKEFVMEDEMHSQFRIIKNEHLKLVDKIISKSEYASTELLKLAVHYRYCENNYLYAKGHDNPLDILKWEDNFNKEMDLIIKEIVQCIKKEIKIMLKLCDMEFSEYEKS